MDKRLADFLYIFLVITIVCFMGWCVWYLKSNEFKCLADPVEYFQEKNPGTICHCHRGLNVYGTENSETEYDYLISGVPNGTQE
jgi:hypothetical protein